MNDDQKPGAGNQGSSDPHDSAASPLLRIEDAIRSHTQKWEADKSTDQPYKHLSLIFTGLSLAVGGVGAILAVISVVLSANQTRVNRQALVAVQRAFVFPAEIDARPVTIPAQGRDVVVFHPVWENSGATPTRNFYQYFKVEIVPRESVSSYDMDPKPNAKYVLSVIAPHTRSPGGVDNVPLADALAVGRLDKPDVIAFGELHYLDVFGGSHVTKFCYDYQSLALLPQPPPPVVSQQTSSAVPPTISNAGATFLTAYQTCPVHNCADEECRSAP